MRKELFSDYNIYKDKILNVEVFKGTVLPGSIANTKTIQSKDPHFSYYFDLISDYRNTSFDTVLTNITEFAEKMKKNGVPYTDTHRNAILISSSVQKLHVDVFINFKDKEGKRIRVFFSLEEALVWLNRTEEFDFINQELNELLENPRIHYALAADY